MLAEERQKVSIAIIGIFCVFCLKGRREEEKNNLLQLRCAKEKKRVFKNASEKNLMCSSM
jgi:hypothetical protein